MATDVNVGIESGVQDEILKKLDTTNVWYVKAPRVIDMSSTGTGNGYTWSYSESYNIAKYTRTGRICALDTGDGISKLYGDGTIILDSVIPNSHTVSLTGYGTDGEHTVNDSGYTSENVYILGNSRAYTWTNAYDDLRRYGNTHLTNVVNFGVDFSNNQYTFDNGKPLSLQYKDGNSGSAIVPLWDETGVDILALSTYSYFSKYRDVAKGLTTIESGVTYKRQTSFKDTTFINVPVVYSEDDAIAYIRNGSLPDNTTMIFSENPVGDGTSDPSISNEKPKYVPQPTDSDTGEQKESGETPNRDNLPIITPRSKGCLLYACTAEQVDAFFNWLWNGIDWEKIAINSVTGLYGNLADCVIGLDYVPFPISELYSTASANIVLGRYGTDISANSIGAGKKTYYKIDDLQLKPFRNDFFAYNGYSEIKLYLPCVGFVDLDANLATGRTISIEFAYDVYTGHGSYALFSNGILFATYDCDFALHLPYAVSTMDSIVQKGVESAAKALTALPSGGATIIGTGIDLFTNSPSTPLNIGGSVNPTTAYMTGFNPRWFAKYPTPCPPKDYGEKVGYLSMQSHQLSSLSGYTKCMNPRITFNDFTPTKAEEEEIYSLLESGVIL